MRLNPVMRIFRQGARTNRTRVGKLVLVSLACVAAFGLVANTRVMGVGGVGGVGSVDESAQPTPQAASLGPAVFQQYCLSCHGAAAKKAGINLEQLLAQGSVGENFQTWERVINVLEQKTMPPRAMPQPSDEERAQALAWVRGELASYVKAHDGDPGRVTVRRLTSGEYAYTIKDLTGLDLNVGIDASSDSVGGEGFTNFGDVQFMQDANLERYLEAAKQVAEHAVIGAGPLDFFADPGKTGFELAAITRIKDIYAKYGIRTVSGEGGRPFGLEKYGKALYAAWRFKHRAALGEANATMKEIAAREGINLRLAEHMWQVVNNSSLGYPSSEVAARWQKLAAPTPDGKATETAARAGCDEIQKFLVTWPSWLFARGDVAAGGAGDESPLVFNDSSLNVESKHRFIFIRGGIRGGPYPPGPAKIYLNVDSVNPAASGKPVVIWRNLTVGIRKRPAPQTLANNQQPAAPANGESTVQPAAGQNTEGKTPPAQPAAQAATPVDQQAAVALRRGQLPPGPRQTLRSAVTPEMAKKLNFGHSPDGTPIGPDDFATEGSAVIEIPMPEGNGYTLDLEVFAELGSNRDQVVRILIADREDGKSRGIPTRALIGDMKSAGYKAFRAGVEEYARLMPPNSHGEPTPADKDPVPLPFDSTYNVPEHDEFIDKVKYIRDDKYLVEYLIDVATRARLNQAWTDLYYSFAYHDNYLRLLAEHYKFDLKGKGIAQMDKAQMAALPAEMRKYVAPLRAEYVAVQEAQAAARPGHVADCLKFAARAWRRPLTEKEKLGLRAFYDKTISADPDHTKAIRALIARILVAPQFLYRVELAADASPVRSNASFQPDQSTVRPLTNYELASRLSFFLWASIPDDELMRAATAGELSNPQGIERQVKRMLADPKARRLSTEFFGQWLGFYHFDQHKGVDTSRFPEFTDDVKEAMYDEAVSFFEHIIRQNRPVRELLTADYTFLNQDLAKFYGVKKDVKAKDQVERVEGVSEFHRGGMLRLGAILTVTSAPLRTSPVKRGDWILRRILGTPVPPPPADAGSLPSDDKMFGGLTLKQKLTAHKRNASCANCHTRIDPLGFSLEHFDSTGRWRDKYADGKAIEDSDITPDKVEIAGVDGLLKYLQMKDRQVRRTLSFKLVGYALGRTITAADLPLIDRMLAAGGDATFAQLAAEIATSKQFRNRAIRDESPAQQAPPAPSTAPATEKTKVARNATNRNHNRGTER